MSRPSLCSCSVAAGGEALEEGRFSKLEAEAEVDAAADTGLLVPVLVPGPGLAGPLLLELLLLLEGRTLRSTIGLHVSIIRSPAL